MSWLYLTLSIVFETLATSALKMSNGFTVLLPTLGAIFGYVFCFGLFSLALKTIDMSVAYAIWGSVGMVLIALISMIFFHETFSFAKILFISFIIVGTVGLKIIS